MTPLPESSRPLISHAGQGSSRAVSGATPMNAVADPNKIVTFKCHLTPDYREILAILATAQRYRSATEAFEASLAHWAQAPAKHWLTSEHAPEKGFLRETRGRQ